LNLQTDKRSEWDDVSVNSEHGDVDESNKLNQSNMKKPIGKNSMIQEDPAAPMTDAKEGPSPPKKE